MMNTLKYLMAIAKNKKQLPAYLLS